MMIILSVLLAVFMYLFSSVLNAQPYGAKLCANDSEFSCYTVKRGDNWNKLFTASEQRDLVMRINRMNTHLYPGLKIAIPHDINANPLEFSPLARNIAPPGEKIIIVSFDRLAFGAYNANGTLEYWGPVSGGRGYCPDVHRKCNSPRGRFAIYNKEGRRCVSTKFPVGRGGAPMPYCMFFHGGFALHGSYEVPGYNASHGCVRMFVNDAQWLNQDFTSGERNVPVILR